MTALKTLLFTVIMPGAATVYIPYWLLSSPSARASLPIGDFRYMGLMPILLGAVCLIFHLFVVLYEEPALRRKFGDPYQRYCQTVPRWFPIAFFSGILYFLSAKT